MMESKCSSQSPSKRKIVVSKFNNKSSTLILETDIENITFTNTTGSKINKRSNKIVNKSVDFVVSVSNFQMKGRRRTNNNNSRNGNNNINSNKICNRINNSFLNWLSRKSRVMCLETDIFSRFVIFWLLMAFGLLLRVDLSEQQSFFSPHQGTSEESSLSSSLTSSSSSSWDSPFRSGSSTYGNGFTCLNIPLNFTLCKDIGYSKMMIPNLLGHDSLQEADYHAKSWILLVGVQCHPDTQLFLCSLFSPICLDRPIYPCRSLCKGVQEKCEPRMLTYNYPWPDMLNCDKFPEDHDLCIKPGAANNSEKIDPEPDCPSCNQAHTCENIVDHFCRADFVFRAKFKRSRGSSLEFRRGKWFKPREGSRNKAREFRDLTLDHKDNCCSTKLRSGLPYIVMGVKRGDQNVATFVMPWSGNDKILKNAIRTFRSMDCSNPLPMSVGTENGNRNGTAERGGRRRRRKQGRRSRQYGGCRVSTSNQ